MPYVPVGIKEIKKKKNSHESLLVVEKQGFGKACRTTFRDNKLFGRRNRVSGMLLQFMKLTYLSDIFLKLNELNLYL